MNRYYFLSLVTWIFSGCSNHLLEKSEKPFHIPYDYYKLENGLKVVLSEDHSAPTVIVAVYYNIGFRVEPRNRTGFAHLFEHMMFQGSKNFPKGEFDKLTQNNGGFNNGSTRFDFTNYYEVMPSHMLEPILWAEADRMQGLDLNQTNLENQQGVVKNEVKVNVLNQPYGGFPWLDMPQYANENWYNAHNFYGDLAQLDAATLDDVRSFFSTYYSPNNAVLTIVGGFNPDDAKQWVEKYFAAIPPSRLPQLPDLTEPRQTKEKRFVKDDLLANKPAIAIAYKMPDRNSPEYFAMGLIDQLLLQGPDSRLYQRLVQEKGYSSNVTGGINYLGNMFNYNGPMLWMWNMVYDENVSADSIVAEADKVVAAMSSISQQDLDLAIIKLRSSFYDEMSHTFGFGKADMLSCFALFDDDPGRINSIESEFRRITTDVVTKTVREYLRPENRTILIVNPKAPD